MPDCPACGQPLQTKPTRCFRCSKPISVNQAFTYDRVRGICTPRHRDCTETQAVLL